MKPSAESSITVTPLAASTSSAVAVAGPDSAWLSAPMNIGPSVPCSARYSQMAWVMARMWSRLNAVSRLDPRWPEVPNTTRWSGIGDVGMQVLVGREHGVDVDEIAGLSRLSCAWIHGRH